MELMVVLLILGVLFGLTAVYFATFNKSEQVQRGADQLAGWLLVARQQARRDGRPTGVWLVVNTSTTNFAGGSPAPDLNQIFFIQQPEDFAQGLYVGAAPVAAGQPSNKALLRLGPISELFRKPLPSPERLPSRYRTMSWSISTQPL
jgi:type II secretory pathway pseudopilin PulG